MKLQNVKRSVVAKNHYLDENNDILVIHVAV